MKLQITVKSEMMTISIEHDAVESTNSFIYWSALLKKGFADVLLAHATTILPPVVKDVATSILKVSEVTTPIADPAPRQAWNSSPSSPDESGVRFLTVPLASTISIFTTRWPIMPRRLPKEPLSPPFIVNPHTPMVSPVPMGRAQPASAQTLASCRTIDPPPTVTSLASLSTVTDDMFFMSRMMVVEVLSPSCPPSSAAAAAASETYAHAATFDDEWPPQTTATAASLSDTNNSEISSVVFG
mmetsp:Transcript_103411/g.178158  ORF Transcript_103411/g.178158 Transcript_103411/m.178158 type:complete len:242 (-) Transcript_103411:1729-2454(-)